jgi:hypothetical protein
MRIAINRLIQSIAIHITCQAPSWYVLPEVGSVNFGDRTVAYPFILPHADAFALATAPLGPAAAGNPLPPRA